MQFYLSRPDGTYSDFGDYPSQPAARTDGQWIAGEPPAGAQVFRFQSPLDLLEQIITQGQNAMSEAPLPTDIQKQIFDLEVFVQNYYRRGATQLILDTINSFVIDPSRTDVTSGQRDQVNTLKSQMLAVFSG